MAKAKPSEQPLAKNDYAAQQLPDFLQGQEVVGVDELKDFMIVPRMKIVQPGSTDLKEEGFAEGSILVMPNKAEVFRQPGRGEEVKPLKVVPLLFFPEWYTSTDIKLKGQENMIRYRTTDPNDPIVMLSRNPETREQDDPRHPGKGYKINHVESLNYVVAVYRNDAFKDLAVMGFANANNNVGKRWASLIRARSASIFGCVFDVQTVFRKNQQGSWYGYEVTNPADGAPWVTREEYEELKKLREQVDSFFRSGKLQTVADEPGSDKAAATPSDRM